MYHEDVPEKWKCKTYFCFPVLLSIMWHASYNRRVPQNLFLQRQVKLKGKEKIKQQICTPLV